MHFRKYKKLFVTRYTISNLLLHFLIVRNVQFVCHLLRLQQTIRDPATMLYPVRASRKSEIYWPNAGGNAPYSNLQRVKHREQVSSYMPNTTFSQLGSD